MKYYFIYSAGGGAGDWNGIKRIWNSTMPEILKSNILLKFGDIFFNHVSSAKLIRPQRWNEIDNIRQWLFNNVNDNFVLDNSEILLDSGTAKIVAWIAHHNPQISVSEILNKFDSTVEELHILEKYANIIVNSNINYTVSFDIPNPFKIRSQNGNTRTNLMNNNENDIESEQLAIQYCAKYTNKLYEELTNRIGEQNAINKILITCNGEWSKKQYDYYLSLLNFEPINIAIGGLTRSMLHNVKNLVDWNIQDYSKIHYLGCGGIENVNLLKEKHLDYINSSVDVSTPLNRAIDGNISNTKWSGYFSYINNRLYRIKIETKEQILNIHRNSVNTLFSEQEMSNIIDSILLHQNGQSSQETYNARAKLILHNSDVFRCNAL